MLAGMTSLTPLAHNTAQAAQPLTPSTIAFFATAATIIPVLFLAIAVQGRAFEDLIKAMDVLVRHTEDSVPWYARGAHKTAHVALSIAAAGILVYGVGSEIVAIYTLYQQKDEHGAGQAVLDGVIVMIIATAAGPALNFIKYAWPFRQAGKQPPQTPPPTSA